MPSYAILPASLDRGSTAPGNCGAMQGSYRFDRELMRSHRAACAIDPSAGNGSFGGADAPPKVY
jgi:hypothetical protein